MFSYAVTGNCDGTATIDWDMGLSLEDALSQTNALDVSSCFNVAAAVAQTSVFGFGDTPTRCTRAKNSSRPG